MPMRLRHLARPRAASTAPPVTAASIRRELSLLRDLVKVEAKVDESRRLYDGFSRRIFPVVVAVLLLVEANQDASIKELKESVAKLKEEKEKAASTTMASSSAMPASEAESEPTVAMLKEEKDKVASATTASSSAMPASQAESEPTVAMLKEKEKAASAMTASSSAMPASEPESELTVTNGTSCVGGST
ncbi:nuclear localization sequence-binding protein-like [Miscanthus floridulus]|uniref:nuclear localization sequence-binding protein-like n=1 Tax=Miscanthus floridulus TaxID=154761 RepID=UPI0034593423